MRWKVSFMKKLTYYLEENAEFSNGIIKRSLDAYKVRDAARKARDDARSDKKKNKKEVTLSGKLTPAQGKDKTKNELFLVEGDSAGGFSQNKVEIDAFKPYYLYVVKLLTLKKHQ